MSASYCIMNYILVFAGNEELNKYVKEELEENAFMKFMRVRNSSAYPNSIGEYTPNEMYKYKTSIPNFPEQNDLQLIRNFNAHRPVISMCILLSYSEENEEARKLILEIAEEQYRSGVNLLVLLIAATGNVFRFSVILDSEIFIAELLNNSTIHWMIKDYNGVIEWSDNLKLRYIEQVNESNLNPYLFKFKDQTIYDHPEFIDRIINMQTSSTKYERIVKSLFSDAERLPASPSKCQPNDQHLELIRNNLRNILESEMNGPNTSTTAKTLRY